ncbi:MAG: Gfo/Idh/MocA family oxidoreductase [Lentisphaerae bacterium]|jgi:UDP-N-acetylglucosamine 3-dehydrogenase|nr:Gfo/Idh/MocA family oxidoreductase [Lentisphaerota bacterium]MBT5607950.1 Gfo/Idh/MocA family oxidoreductase [Lentisphaerota bacterium]MBT7056530.1 Gfo/Idh/MocA family oxidoreductase [Lentisphaerota bacterium]MBT7846321.1 Gfo/Idh/MocA family oxidoreductase [Lentisphaerota bacterium]
MAKLRAGVIGCGGRGQGHALGYSLSEHVELVACADIHRPAAERMAGRFEFPGVYTDYNEMLAAENLDIVSMCLWPDLHETAVLDCVRAATPPRLINAEKPMAPTYGECVRMHTACQEAGIMLTFSHQRRFSRTFALAKELIDEGAVGTLQRMEMSCSNLLDWGTHWFDMMLFYNGNLEPDWVMGQIDCAADQLVFGARIETGGLSYIKWPNNVTGLLTTGQNTGSTCAIRVIGSAGLIEVDHGKLRLWQEGGEWHNVPPRIENVPGEDTSRHILNSVECLLEGEDSTLCSANSLRATQLIFATYESARRRQRVLLPLEIDDSPLISMLRKGTIAIPDWPAFLTDEEQNEGAELLFNGTDLAGLKALPEEAWGVTSGIVRGGYDRPGVIRTAETYGDVSVSFEFRLRSRGQARVSLRCDEQGENGLDIVLADDRMEPVSEHTSGALEGLVAPEQNPRVGGSAWVYCEVTCRGTQLIVSFGDVMILNADVVEIPGLGTVPKQGHIAFKAVSGPVDIREIIAMPPEEPE